MRRGTNGKQQSKGSKRIEDFNQDKRSEKLLRIHQLLLKIYLEI